MGKCYIYITFAHVNQKPMASVDLECPLKENPSYSSGLGPELRETLGISGHVIPKRGVNGHDLGCHGSMSLKTNLLVEVGAPILSHAHLAGRYGVISLNVTHVEERERERERKTKKQRDWEAQTIAVTYQDLTS